ncbi:reverse transcriptase [Apostichopus japonicus]|uniref:Reverse transcriptase n=1 Tax=Stichopus japonicus TaxID=307972 RepID=A0A2G8K4A5_STIJA|nr:reverse transcriptase [Apostichopus japonicus]
MQMTCSVFRVWAPFATLAGFIYFERATGAKLNPEKTKGLRLGSWRYRDLPFGASWSDQNIKINGIWFGYDAPCDVTWNERAEVFESRLETFGTRWLSILGKVTVINRFVSPILCTDRPGAVYPIPRRVLVRLERAIFSFIWSGGTELVKRALVGVVSDLDRPCNGRPFLVGRTGLRFIWGRSSSLFCCCVASCYFEETYLEVQMRYSFYGSICRLPDKYPPDNHPRDKNPEDEYLRGQLPRDNYPGHTPTRKNTPMTINPTHSNYLRESSTRTNTPAQIPD